MTLGTILLIILILMLLGAFPRWGYNRNWGYGPSGGLGLVLVIVLILVLLGRCKGRWIRSAMTRDSTTRSAAEPCDLSLISGLALRCDCDAIDVWAANGYAVMRRCGAVRKNVGREPWPRDRTTLMSFTIGWR